MLVDLQPYGKPIALEARLGERGPSIGSAEDCAEKRENMRLALRVLDDFERCGWFRVKARAEWIFETVIATPDAWTEFVQRPSAGRLSVDLEAVERTLSQPGGSIATREDDLALVYDRTEPPRERGYEGA